MKKNLPISQELLEILACPACKSEVVLNEEYSGLKCTACQLIYPIRDGIPIMLIEEATKEESGINE